MSTAPPFVRNDRLLHRYNPDLGPGRVVDVAPRRLVVLFPKTGAKLTFAADDSALRPLTLLAGQRVRVESTGEEIALKERVEGGWRLADGRVVGEKDVWPLEVPDDPLEHLASLELDRAAAFRNRLDALDLSRVRQARGLGSFLGGRIGIYPHQLHVAERATAADPVRWLLADEVGLGKTIEACLILSRLLRQERADRALVVAPATLTVQWLGELYRKFHQTFVLLDRKRREDVAADHGKGFNPFEAHRHAVISLEDLVGDPHLVALATEAGLDLLVVDEAHRLEKERHGSAEDAWRAVEPLARAARHVLLLTATPLEADLHGFFDLLSLLRPDAYGSYDDFVRSLEEERRLPPCTSATRRADIGGLPPRVRRRVDLSREPAQPGLTGNDAEDREDPRVAWLEESAAAFSRGGAEEGKTLVFCHDHETLAALKSRLETATRRRVAIFHEDLSPERRDLEVAEFRRADGPGFLVSTECGGEGRNFEFCRRLVLFDLPRDPAQVEQRIGRLDRINRTRDVEIVYFCPPAGFERELVSLYERIGLFDEPLGGLERSLAHVEAVIRRSERLWKVKQELPVDELAAEVRRAAAARQAAAYRHLHVDGYESSKAEGILSRVPEGLDLAIERFVLEACAIFGFDTVQRAGRSWYIEFGGDALVEHLPGVPGGSRYLGTFSREEAVAREDLEFFSSGHPLVEGIFQELEDGSRGRVALVQLSKAQAGGVPAGNGLLFVHRTPGDGLAPGWAATAVDLTGRLRPEWAEALTSRRGTLRGVKSDDWFAGLKGQPVLARDWPSLCHALAERVAHPGRLLAVAGFRIA